MVVGFTTTYGISAYHLYSCKFESRSWRGVLEYDLISCIFFYSNELSASATSTLETELESIKELHSVEPDNKCMYESRKLVDYDHYYY